MLQDFVHDFFVQANAAKVTLPMKSHTLRLPIKTYDLIDALADMADTSRNATMAAVLDQALQEVLYDLPVAKHAEIARKVYGPDAEAQVWKDREEDLGTEARAEAINEFIREGNTEAISGPDAEAYIEARAESIKLRRAS